MNHAAIPETKESLKKTPVSVPLIYRVCLLPSFSKLVYQILECAPMWPQLEDLCVEENNITELQRWLYHASFPPSVVSVSWSWLLYLMCLNCLRPQGVLQFLRSLNLSSNPLVQHSVLSVSALSRYSTQLQLQQLLFYYWISLVCCAAVICSMLMLKAAKPLMLVLVFNVNVLCVVRSQTGDAELVPHWTVWPPIWWRSSW